MRVLLTGSTGYLGQKVVKELLNEGISLTGLTRKRIASTQTNYTVGNELTSDYKLLECDITSKVSLTHVARKISPDTIIHLAAKVPQTPKDDKALTMLRHNVMGVINVLEAFPAVSHVILASTAEVYGLHQSQKRIDEHARLNPPSHYAASKAMAEYVCRIQAKRAHFILTVLRFTIIYGANDRINRALPNFIAQARAGEDIIVYGGRDIRDYLYIDDAARAVRLALLARKDGIYNIGTGKATSIRQAARAVAQCAKGQSRIIIKQSRQPISAIVLNGQNAMIDLGFKPKFYFPDKLEELLSQ